MTVPKRIHEPAEALLGEQLPAVHHYREDLTRADDPLVRLLQEAPIDDEPSTAEQDRIADESWRGYRRITDGSQYASSPDLRA